MGDGGRRRWAVSVLLLWCLLPVGLWGKGLGRSRPARVWLRDVDVEITPTFIGFDDTERGPGLEWTLTRRRGIRDDRLSLAVSRLEVEEPEDRFRFRFARVRFERRRYLRHRLYAAGGGGWHFFHPRTAIRDWHHAVGARSPARWEPYLHVAVGWQIGRWRLRRTWLPLTLRSEFVKGEAYDFERPLPSGLADVDPTGWRLTLRSEFRF